MQHAEIKVRRKSLWRSENNKRARKFANMRAAKERRRLERVQLEPTPPDLSHCPRTPRSKPLFVVSIRCRDGESVLMRIHELPFGGLSISPSMAGRKIAAVLAHYRPVQRVSCKDFP